MARRYNMTPIQPGRVLQADTEYTTPAGSLAKYLKNGRISSGANSVDLSYTDKRWQRKKPITKPHPSNPWMESEVARAEAHCQDTRLAR